MTVVAVIVAGGSGLRAGGEKPKQYQLIGGKPVIWWTLKAFAQHPAIAHVQPVIAEGHESMFAEAVGGLSVAEPVIGGSTRQASCRIGIEAAARFSPVNILIQDAARPFASPDLITQVISWLDLHPGIIPGLPVADTLKYAPGGMVARTLDRFALWTAQTPQGFSFAKILEAHRAAFADKIDNLTDDAAVAERNGIAIAMIPGRLENRKITTREDIEHADHQLKNQMLAGLPDIRTGQGIDFHAFETGDAVMLCGVRIPHSRKLKGHSDADVALHALTDAIFGAVGEGDIGLHFPPSDEQWKGAASSVFLEKAVRLVHGLGGIIANVDVTIVAESPSVAPHIGTMKAMLAPLLQIDAGRIAIKATTTEKLGAVGRGEGIAAWALATVRLP